MTSLALPRTLRRGLAHTPLSPRAWRDTAFAAAGAAMMLPAIVPPLLVLGVSIGPGHVPVRVAALLLLAGTLLLPSWLALLTALQRARFRALLGVTIPPSAGGSGLLHPRAAADALRSPLTWRQATYHVLVTPLAAMAGVATLTAWSAGLALALLPAYAKPLMSAGAAHIGKPWVVTGSVTGLVLLFTAPWLAAAVVRLDTRAALALLGPSRAEQLARRVERLAESRAGMVDAADAERRRIERDLHDGAQRRLVALAMNLGMARAELTGLPEEAHKVIAEAHEEAKLALAELRDLVRGLHPAILEDRGLDAALSGIAARSPVPVRLRVDVPGRATPTVEAVAYFVVSEALTNIAKHSRASRAEVAVDQPGGLLRVVVTDDGVGGADPARGSGLAGLARRAASVDGTLRIASPAGGPTTITVELPCAS